MDARTNCSFNKEHKHTQFVVDRPGRHSSIGKEMAPPAAMVVIFLVSSLLQASSAAAQSASGGGAGGSSVHVGVILDLGTLVGKIARTSVLLAVDDFYAAHPNYRTRLVLHVRDAMSDDVQAASAAIDLLENFKVQAIIGPQKSSQASFLSDLGNISQIPIISFTATSPGLYSGSLPYFVRSTLSDSAQMNSIASLIKAYGWRDVVPIYEDTIYGRGIIPYLIDALQEIDSRIPYRSVIPLSASSDQIAEELYKLKTMPTRVFVVHMSSALASLLFTKAKEVGLMDKGYVWIMTDGITNIIDSLNPSVVEAMNGALGIKFYVPRSVELDNFTKRWNRRFQLDNPKDPPLQLSVFGLWGYDTIFVVAQAAEKIWATNITSLQKQTVRKNLTGLGALESSANGPEFLNAILQNKFKGLSGSFDLSNRQLQASIFEIINVDGKGWKEIAFWTAENGISRQFNPTRLATTNSVSVSDLHVTWPGGSTEIPKGWEIPASGRKLKVGVHKSGYPEFMNYSKDPTTDAIKASGFAIDVFEEAARRVPYALPFEYVASDAADLTSRSYEESSSYDDFVYQVYLKKYDLAVGDITIRYNRTFYVDFTLPYTESGVAMVVPVKEVTKKNALIFLKPLSLGMWLCSLAFFFGTGGVVWLLERLDADKIKRSLSRAVLIVWLFFFLVLTSSYTASLASMLTVQQLNPTVTDIHDLLRNGDYVGYHRGSYVKGFLEGLGFDKSKMKAYDSPDDFHKALSSGSDNGGIAALVHEVPYIKLFLAKHCEGYTMIGPIYKTAGFGFAFPKGSTLLGDISKAILNITEGDTIIQIEKKWIGDQNNCNNVGSITSSGNITLGSFWGLFLFTGSVSVACLLIGLIIYFTERCPGANGANAQVGNGAAQDTEMDRRGNEHEENAHENPEQPRAPQTILLLLLLAHFTVAQNANKTGLVDGFPVGVILDLQTLVGKIARTSILMALDDFYAAHKNYSTKIVLHIRDSGSNNVQAASAALDLLENHNVQIIIGPQKSSQASFVSDLGNRSQVPVISFTATSPSLYSASLPYFIRATLNDSAQVQSIACLIKTYGWREVVPIYEDTDYGRGIIPYLVDALEDIDARVPYRSVIPLSATTEEISEELYKLMTMQTRVFIVHMSSTLAASLFTKAKEVGMMSKGFVWIMTDGITNIVDSMSSSVLEAMNGALGIQFYVNNSELDSFTIGWNRRFQIDNQNDPPLKLSIFGLWGYDTIWAVAQAVENVGVNNRTSFQKPSVARNSTSLADMETSVYGPELVKVILKNKFRGKSGYFDLSNRQLKVSTFRIINVFGKGWKDIGFWNEGNGISRQLNLGKSTTKYVDSVSDLNPVTWPGKSTEIPKGWEIPASGKKLKVGVHKSAYKEYMTNQRDPITGAIKASGFSIDIFEEAVKRLPYALPYEYVAFDTSRDTSTGSYDDFVHQVYLKKYDVAIGDITIRYSRMAYVDFTVPYTESGVAMIVPSKGTVDKTWIFLQPLSRDLWFATILMFVYTGSVVWLLELLGNKRNIHERVPRKIGIAIFFSLFGDSYTANLATMLTVQQLKPTINSIDELRKSGVNIGYHDGSFVKNLLEDLNFNTSKIKAYDTPDDFYDALSKGSNNGGIAAFVHEVPYIKLFLAKHCKEYTMVGPFYKTAGFGYGLLILTGVASTSSLIIAVMIYFYEKKSNGESLEENHKPQEMNEGDRAEQNNHPGPGHQSGQQQEETGGREMGNINLQTRSVRSNGSIFIWRDRNLGARVAPISRQRYPSSREEISKQRGLLGKLEVSSPASVASSGGAQIRREGLPASAAAGDGEALRPGAQVSPSSSRSALAVRFWSIWAVKSCLDGYR
uniref:Ionotropic glutamate receptor C-terminal domain-containing protein n=1 Tax=Oryza punctata TaxID=4537 RepID=A0A0E0M1H3_ORYPU